MSTSSIQLPESLSPPCTASWRYGETRHCAHPLAKKTIKKTNTSRNNKTYIY